MGEVIKLKPSRRGTWLRNARMGCQRVQLREDNGDGTFYICPRKSACSSCTSYWRLVNEKRPVTWLLVSLEWIVEENR